MENNTPPPIKLTAYLRSLLKEVSVPLDDSIRKQKKKEVLRNDFLLVSKRIDFLLEKLYHTVNNDHKEIKPPKKKTVNDDIEVLFELLLVLFSNVVLLNYVSVSSWLEDNEITKTQNKRLMAMLKDLNKMGKHFMRTHKYND